MPAELEPISYMKHGGKRHKGLLAKRKGKKARKALKEFVEDNPDKLGKIRKELEKGLGAEWDEIQDTK